MFRKSRKWRFLLAGAGVAAVAAGGSAAALATGSSSSKVYAGCLSAGKLYNVHTNPSHAVHCAHGGTAISWNQAGPAGAQGLTGPQGPRGATGPTGSRGPQGLQGVQGLQGLQGIQGIQGQRGAPGVSPTLTPAVQSKSVDVPNNNVATWIFACPAGDIASGGGGGSTAAATGLVLEASQPTVANSQPSGWEVQGVNTSGSTQTMSAYLICLPTAAQSSQAARAAAPTSATVQVRALGG